MNAPDRTVAILVAGIGNIFCGDDAFGLAVARRLSARTLLSGVTVRDFGIRGMDLVHAAERVDALVLVDAVRRGGAPGTIYVIDVDGCEAGEPDAVDAHSLDPASVLRLLGRTAARPRRIVVVGCEPASTEMDADGALTPAVAAAVDEACLAVAALVERLRSDLAAETLIRA